MDTDNAIRGFEALAQATRLTAFRLLLETYPDGMAAGEIARRCGVPHNTLSTHLAVLMRAGLIDVRRHGRVMDYRADLDAFSRLIGFLARDCCGGRPEICVPLAAEVNRLACMPTGDKCNA